MALELFNDEIESRVLEYFHRYFLGAAGQVAEGYTDYSAERVVFPNISHLQSLVDSIEQAHSDQVNQNGRDVCIGETANTK